DLPCDASGAVPKALRWNLSKLRGLPPPPVWLGNFGLHAPALEKLNELRAVRGQPLVHSGAMPPQWRELLKATVLNELLVKKNKPGPLATNLVQPLRILSTCAGELAPWELSGD